MKLSTLFVLPALLFGMHAERGHAQTSKTPWFVDSSMPTEAQAAHDSFLRGDWERLPLDIKRALMAYPGDAAIRRDMLDLYDKAYELKGGSALKPDWSAPAGVSWLGVASKKKYNVSSHNIQHRIQFSVDFPKEKEVEQLRVTRYPNEAIIDKEARLGEFSESPEGDKQTNVFAAQEYHASANADGLYLFELKFKGEPATSGWFLMNHLNAPESPEILEPAPGATLSSTPTFRWKDFVSSEYRGYETRRTSAYVTRRDPTAMDNTWWTETQNPFTQVTVGSGEKKQQGAIPLPKDDYVVQVLYRERHYFGDLQIGRDSGTILPFSVK